MLLSVFVNKTYTLRLFTPCTLLFVSCLVSEHGIPQIKLRNETNPSFSCFSRYLMWNVNFGEFTDRSCVLLETCSSAELSVRSMFFVEKLPRGGSHRRISFSTQQRTRIGEFISIKHAWHPRVCCSSWCLLISPVWVRVTVLKENRSENKNKNKSRKSPAHALYGR